MANKIDINGYAPSDQEPFMNERQLEYFKRRLIDWKQQLIEETSEAIKQLKEVNGTEADIVDIATYEIERNIELRARERQRKLLNKIDEALVRIEKGTYGYCEETGDPISLRRLEARPIATLSLEAQERHERSERLYRNE